MGTTQVVQIPFVGGIDQKTAVEYLEGSQNQTSIVNANFDKNGALDKRLGMARLGKAVNNASSNIGIPIAGTPIGATYRLASWSRSPLMAFCDSGVFDYDKESAAFSPVGALPPVRSVRRPLPTPGYQPTSGPPVLCDFQQGGRNLRLAFYEGTTGQAFFTLYDADTFETIQAPTLFPASFNNGELAIAVFDSGVSNPNRILIVTLNVGSLYGYGYNPSTNVLTMGTLITTVPTAFDVALSGAGLLVATASDTGTVSFKSINNAFAVLTTVTVATGAGTSPPSRGVTIYPDPNGFVWIGWNYATVPTYAVYTGFGATFSVYRAVTTITTTGGGGGVYGFVTTGATTATLIYRHQNYNNVGFNSFSTNTYGAASLSTTSGASLRGLPWGCDPVAKPFTFNGQPVYAAMTMDCINVTGLSGFPQTVDSSLILIALPVSSGVNPRLMAIAAPRQLVYKTLPFYLPSVSAYNTSSTTSYGFSVPVVTYGADSNASTLSQQSYATVGAWSVDFLFDTALSFASTDVQGNLVIAAGVPCACDSGAIHETSFVKYPEFAYATPTGTATINTAYAVVYVAQDGAGNLSRSAPYQLPPVVSATSVTLTIPLQPISLRDTPVATNVTQAATLIEIYKSVAGGSTLYYVTSIAGSPSYSPGASPTTTYVDTSPGTVDATASILYTTGGVLDSVIPPGGRCIISHRGRIWRSDDTQQAVWFTKQATPGDEPSFNEAMVFPCPEGGDITAFASMDDKLVIFKASTILIVYGDGPASTGQGSDLTIPQRIASDVGAVDWRGIVVAPPGVFFRAAQGIYLLDRGLNVTYIGKNVEDTLGTNGPTQTIVSAQLVSNSQQVRFVLSSGTVLVYDYQSNVWTLHTYAQLSSAVTSAAVNGLTLALSTSDGNAWQENLLASGVSNYYDQDSTGATHFVPMSVTSAWVRLSSLQAYMRARRVMFLGHPFDPCGITLSVAVNYSGATVQTATFGAGFLSGQLAPQCVAHVAGAYNKSQAIRVTVSDVIDTTTTTGQGCRFIGLAFELDNIGALNRRIPVQARR